MSEKPQFADSLAALVSKEAVLCRGNPDRFAAMIERVAAALGFTIALASNGDGATISKLMDGAEAYAMEEAVQKSRFASFMRSSPRHRSSHEAAV